jgi:Fic family protein
MNARVGKFIEVKVPGEGYKAYIPPKLMSNFKLELESLYPYLERATLAIAELNSISSAIPNRILFIYMYVRKEALLSSQIEGTQSSLNDLILFEQHEKPEVSLDDVEEVSNYVIALEYALNKLKQDFPLSLRLLKETHGILLSGTRGAKRLPGEFRKSQNWIGGTRPGNALYVPPGPDKLMDCLSDFEKFMHEDSYPALIKAGILHLQFESIHPFLDGNGRLGRLLITIILCDYKILKEPILYLSLYLKQNRDLYYSLLQEVRTRGNWETWLEFFLEGITHSAKEATANAIAINKLFDDDLAKLEKLGRIRFTCIKIFDLMKKLPQVSVQQVVKGLDITSPTARTALNKMTEIGILVEITNKQRDKVYGYKKYLDCLES